ncbi:metallophosphoesterase family protein [Peptostreptococcus faecalis]|uniref:metallophosphoesterase family protein n=1 Tax=Peptostreptococcus faecalis TaxID=2045015 RepID=UPI000C7DE8D5|nr:metallophosphoesterase family protein [Peptostreptococcus faecalis]
MEKKEKIDLMLGRLNRENDYPWEEISKMVGLNFSGDHVRKMSYGMKMLDDYNKENSSERYSGQDLKEIKEKILELKRTRQQLSDERTFTNKKIRGLARIEDFINLLRDELELLAYEKPMIVKSEDLNSLGFSCQDNVGILLLSDIHYGIESDNIANKYNTEIAIERMNSLINDTIKYSNLHGIDEIYVFELGDSISGHIHNNLRLENRIDVAQQIIGISELLSSAMFELSKSIKKVNFCMVEGNHDRILPKKDDNLNKDSFAVLVQELIKQRTKNIENFNFIDSIGKTFSKVEIKNKTCFAVHGDKDSSKSVEGLQAISGIKPDYVFMGHFHNANEYTINQSEIIVNGAFSGVDEYAYNIRKNSPPIQKFIIMNENGRLCTYNFNLSN